MNTTTIIGLIGTAAVLISAIYMGGGTILAFIDIPGILIVVVGSVLAMFLALNKQSISGFFAAFTLIFKAPVFNPHEIVAKLMTMSEKARREGLLALEEDLEDMDDEFMKKGIQLVIDGTDAEIVRDLMETELTQMQERHVGNIVTVNLWGSLAPGIGMVGTLIGLIGMLRNMEDKSSLGPNMAMALVTTFYGAMMANLLLLPIGAKLKNYDALETRLKEMQIEGVLSIQAGDNPKILAIKLLSYVNPVDRKAMEAELSND